MNHYTHVKKKGEDGRVDLRNNIAVRIAPTIFMILTSLLSLLPSAYAWPKTSGGTMTGVYVCGDITFTQDQFEEDANWMNFIVYSSVADINYWCVQFPLSTGFCSSHRNLPSQREVFVNLDATIKFNDNVWVWVDLWLTDGNSMGFKELFWSRIFSPNISRKIAPDHVWALYAPRKTLVEGVFSHRFSLQNDDPSESFNLTGFSYVATMEKITNLTTIDFPTIKWIPQSIALEPNETYNYNIPTDGTLIGGYIYIKYSVEWNGTVCTARFAHPITAGPVGGFVVPIDKVGSVDRFGLLPQYVGLASIILIVVVATATYVKCFKRREAKNT